MLAVAAHQALQPAAVVAVVRGQQGLQEHRVRPAMGEMDWRLQLQEQVFFTQVAAAGVVMGRSGSD
jgi:hypothetical protein